MAFIYDVNITVHSVIENLTDSGLVDGEPEINIITIPGFLKAEREGDVYYISYKEDTDEGRALTDIRLSDGEVMLSRRGDSSYDIRFSLGEVHESIYRAGAYSFDMSVLTKKIRNSISREGGELQLIYKMTLGGADKNARMKITVKRV